MNTKLDGCKIDSLTKFDSAKTSGAVFTNVLFMGFNVSTTKPTLAVQQKAAEAAAAEKAKKKAEKEAEKAEGAKKTAAVRDRKVGAGRAIREVPPRVSDIEHVLPHPAPHCSSLHKKPSGWGWLFSVGADVYRLVQHEDDEWSRR